MRVSQVGRDIFIDGVKLPPCPSRNKNVRSSITNGRVFMNGYEYISDVGWKRTIRAFWHYIT